MAAARQDRQTHGSEEQGVAVGRGVGGGEQLLAEEDGVGAGEETEDLQFRLMRSRPALSARGLGKAIRAVAIRRTSSMLSTGARLPAACPRWAPGN